jgi:hypothetical protein
VDVCVSSSYNNIRAWWLRNFPLNKELEGLRQTSQLLADASEITVD